MAQWGLKHILVFWWLLFLVIQQVERFFLLPEVMRIEAPATSLLVKTFVTGLRADLITASIAVLLVFGLGFVMRVVLWPWNRWRKHAQSNLEAYRRDITALGTGMALLLIVLLLIDIGYFQYNHQRLNFVFFEYIGDLVTQWSETGFQESQAAEQTGAELEDSGKWAGTVLGFLLFEALAIGLWWVCFTRFISPALGWLGRGVLPAPNVMLVVGFVGGLTGFHYQGPYAIRLTEISSSTYYVLAQNPILYAGEGLRAVLEARRNSGAEDELDEMPLSEAVPLAQEIIGKGASFPFPEYPFVHSQSSGPGVQFKRPANVLMILVEGLDRRILNKTVNGVRITPFLNRLKDESLYFEHFFSNGVQTARGLFATFCSYYPRQGTAAMKTHYMHDYACLPSFLRERGYWTEMVIGYHRDLNRLHLFMSRNGLNQLFDRSDFPPGIDEIGMHGSIGRPDGALLDMMSARVEKIRANGKPYFLAAMTIGTHHPFAVPLIHEDIRRLKTEPDGYLASLRYLDLELERVLERMHKAGLLKDTMVLILGDHGRHEKVGESDFEKQAGHFMTPLFIWLDETLRDPATYRPRVVTTVASQVDLLPTILGVNAIRPRLSPFVGHDLSCLFAGDCLGDNVAFLSSVYDNLIGLANHEGLLLYSLRSQTLRHAGLDLERPAVAVEPTDPAVAPRYRKMLALYAAGNSALNQNKIWSWKEFRQKL